MKSTIDRGGLIHINDTLYRFFHSLEMAMRLVLKTSEIESSKRETLTPNKDVQFYWITVATDWGEEEASTLMNLMIYHQITIGGFSHVAAYMELTSRKIKREFGRPKALEKT